MFSGRPQMWVVLSRRNLLSLLHAADVARVPFAITSGNARRIVEGNPTSAPDWRLSVTVDPHNYDDGATLRMVSPPDPARAGSVFVDIGRATIQELIAALDQPGGRRDYAVPVAGTQFGWQIGIHLEDDATHYSGRNPGPLPFDGADAP